MTLVQLVSALSSGKSRLENEYAMRTLAFTLGQPQKLVMPGDVSCWKNAALALRLMGRPGFDAAVPAMLCWLRDMSYPGADIIRRTLLETLPRGNLAQYTERAARAALEQEDTQWLCNLGWFIPSAGLQKNDFEDKTVWLILRDAVPADNSI